MAIPLFKAFRSTVTAFTERMLGSADRWLVHPTTGAIVGVQSPTANGADARFTPVDVSLAQILAPTAAMLADLDATYRLNVAPYTRYQSDGVQIVAIGGSSETQVVIPAGFIQLFAAPLTISPPMELIIFGGIKVI